MYHVKIARCLALVLTMAAIDPLSETLARADDIVAALVPAYFYPTWWRGSPWDDTFNAAAARVPVEAIINPAGGPGGHVNSDYQVAVGELQGSGGKVIGYVPTGYGSRSAEDILADVSSYVQWYDVDGIFLDEMGNQLGDLDYVSLYTCIKQFGIELHRRQSRRSLRRC